VVALVSFPKEEYRLKEPDDKEFEEMVEPTLADRLRAFESWLAFEPCQNDGHCYFMSVSRRMCSSCRLRLHFYHCIYNAEAYEDGSGRIPRKGEDETT
jgi:hypothetical protein